MRETSVAEQTATELGDCTSAYAVVGATRYICANATWDFDVRNVRDR